jgi:threonine/homoserine/homoserine lactone efflux protein
MLTTTLGALLAFCAAASLLTITPGPDTALILRLSAAEGRRSGMAAAAGTALGCLVWATVTALGLGALLAASQTAYTILRWVGAAYLVWVGLKLIVKPRTEFAPPSASGPPARGAWSALAKGFLTNVLNPKVGVFYVSFLPQFVPHGVEVAPFIVLLGAVHAAIGLAWLSFLAGATQSLAGWLRRPRVLKILDRLTGAVFLAFGARLALDSRP